MGAKLTPFNGAVSAVLNDSIFMAEDWPVSGEKASARSASVAIHKNGECFWDGEVEGEGVLEMEDDTILHLNS